MRLNPAWIEIIAGLQGAIRYDAVAFQARMLDHDHGIGAGGKRSARHDRNGLARANGSFENFPGANFADQLQHTGQIGGANGVSIAGRAGKRGIISIGHDRFGEHPARAIEDRNLFCRFQRAHFTQDAFASLLKRDGQDTVYRRIAVARPVDSSTSTITECNSAPWRAASIRTGICVRNFCKMMSLSTPITELYGPVIPTSV